MPSLTLRKVESEDIWGQGKCSAVILHWDSFQYFKHLLKRIEIKLIFLIQALINVKSRRVLPHDSDECLATPFSEFAPRISGRLRRLPNYTLIMWIDITGTINSLKKKLTWKFTTRPLSFLPTSCFWIAFCGLGCLYFTSTTSPMSNLNSFFPSTLTGLDGGPPCPHRRGGESNSTKRKIKANEEKKLEALNSYRKRISLFHTMVSQILDVVNDICIM